LGPGSGGGESVDQESEWIMTDKLNITCPHCGTTIRVDTEAEVVVSHEPPVHHRDKTDFDERLQQLGREKARAADQMAEAMRREKDQMAEAMRREKDKSRLMDDRFRELFDETKKKDDGSKPIKDIDLD
jgi:adenine-specific DNA methylase